MSEKRYSCATVAAEFCISPMTVYNRAKRLGIDTRHGFTVFEAKKIGNYRPDARRQKRGSLSELKEELREI